MRFNSLPAWLAWQETLHPRAIELGLERCATVARRMGLLPPPFGVVSVAGTNGKGSSVALLEAAYRAAGYSSGRYLSPHLLRYNERVCYNGQEAGDAALCAAFATVDEARGDISLTYFEFGTLAAVEIFRRQNAQIAILEIGLGGRLDAVNMFDADAALVTAIDLDHTDWLGPDRDSIGFEKAGIFRAGRPAVCSDPNPPRRLLEHAQAIGAEFSRVGQDFSYRAGIQNWRWQSGAAGLENALENLPLPALAGEYQLQNAAGALQILHSLQARYPVPEAAIRAALRTFSLPGRLQRLPARFECLLDVAHNPAGAAVLSRELQRRPLAGQTHALVGMLRDKDMRGALQAMLPAIHRWHIAPLPPPRGADAAELRHILHELGVEDAREYASIAAAFQHLQATLPAADRLVVFGSFYTVGGVLELVGPAPA
jgi:dihydrofolate synthase/folylpolyglutamate synthase